MNILARVLMNGGILMGFGISGNKKRIRSALPVKGICVLGLLLLSVCVMGAVQYNDDCRTLHPNPQIVFDHKDAQGRVYIPVVNWNAYPNAMFRQAPELPPCGANANSSRTWVDIYDGSTNARIYGFCAFSTNADLQKIWFSSGAKSGLVYIIINDRACKKEYKSNVLKWGEQGPQDDCRKVYPNPKIKFDRQDSQGRVYIPVVNWSDYDNQMFRQAPELPPCGANANSSRTWVDIYDGSTNARIYGFCAFSTNADMQKIWFSSGAKSGKVYIIINDRACQKTYKSNVLSWPLSLQDVRVIKKTMKGNK